MDTIIYKKEELLKRHALLEALIRLNHSYYDSKLINGLEFSNYISKKQLLYQDKIFEEEVKLYYLIQSEFNLKSTNKLIKDKNMQDEYFIDFKNNLGLIPISNKKEEIIKKYGFDTYYKLMVATRRLDEYTSKNGLIFPNRIICPSNPNIKIALNDDAFTIFESIDNDKICYTNLLGTIDWNYFDSFCEEKPLLIDNETLLEAYLKSICLDDKVLPSKMVKEIKQLRIIKKN